MADTERSLLSARSSLQLLSKMLDFSKNVHAECIARELSRVEPLYLAMYQIEKFFFIEGCRSSIMNVCKVYVERRETNFKVESTIAALIKSPEIRNDLIEFIRQSQQKFENYSSGGQIALRSHKHLMNN